jgi:hypothetical protein
MKRHDVPSDLLNTKCKGQKEAGAAKSEQAEIEHDRNLEQACEREIISSSNWRYYHELNKNHNAG